MALLYSTQDKKVDPICQKCPWFSGDFSPSIYSSGSRLALVQESPSADDYLSGEIFSGLRGHMVDKWLAGPPLATLTGLTRRSPSSFDLASIHKFAAVKCSLGDGSKPGKAILDLCRSHLVSDVKYAQKKGLRLVVPLGATATRSFFKVSLFGAVRGQPREVEFGDTKVVVFPTLSPAHVLSRRGEEALVKKDFKNIIRVASGLPLKSLLDESKTETIVLNNQVKVRNFLTQVLPKSRVASLDLETTGFDPVLKEVTKNALNYLSGDILTFNFSLGEGVGYVLPVLGFEARKVWSDDFKQSIYGWIRNALGDFKILYIFHNAVFDIPWLVYRVGVDLQKLKYVDTLLMSHLLNEEAPKDLKTLATVHTSLGGYESVLKS